MVLINCCWEYYRKAHQTLAFGSAVYFTLFSVVQPTYRMFYFNVLSDTATIRAMQWIINASYNQRQRFFHLGPEPWML
jgi:hypothetical protein